VSGLARKRAAVVLGVVLVALALDSGCAFAGTRITDVKVTSDLRRVIVRCDGEIGDYHMFSMGGPSRLVIEIPGATLGDVDRVIPAAETGGLTIRLGLGESGPRVVADFGGSQLPEHKIMKIGSCLLIMLAEWTPEKAVQWSASAGNAGNPPPPTPRRKTRVQPSPPSSEHRSADLSDLIIKSADVIDGEIVLKVVHRERPGVIFQIRLGVDFDRLGFSAASIQPMQDRSRPRADSSKDKPEPPGRDAAAARVGPRRVPSPHTAGAQGSDGGRDGGASLVFQNQARPVEGLNAVRARYRSSVAARQNQGEGPPPNPDDRPSR
jgi:hypothetical protein